MKQTKPAWFGRIIYPLIIGGFWISATGLAGQAANPFREHIRPTGPLTPNEEAKSFELPEGFQVQVFAAEPDIAKPMNMVFAADHEQAPYALLERAATLNAKGDLGLDNRLQAAGFNLVRYEVWRGQDYLDAYLEATKRYYGTKRQRDRLEGEAKALLESANENMTSSTPI